MKTFMEFMEANYESIKENLKRYKDFNEDVFHSTIIKCHEIFEENHLKFNSTNDMIRYLIGAYKTNLLRERIYYYEKNTVHPDSLREDPYTDDLDNSVQISIIQQDILHRFGERVHDAYIRYVTGNHSIAALQKICGIKNLKQRFRDIKEYITRKYKNDI